MKEKIKSISEAFSMQPRLLEVNRPMGRHDTRVIKNIELVSSHYDHEDIHEYYVGYDKDNNKIFKYLANTVNVCYYYTTEQP